MKPINLTRIHGLSYDCRFDAIVAMKRDFAAINGRASAHTMTPEAVLAVAERAEAELTSRGLTKRDMIGITVQYSPEMPEAKCAAYGTYDVVSTVIELERRPSGWFLTNYEKKTLKSYYKENLTYCITAEQREKLVEYALRDIRVRSGVTKLPQLKAV